MSGRLFEVLRSLNCVSTIEVVDTEAAAIVVLKRSEVDVVILDLQLKQGTGFGVMRMLRSMGQNPQIIVLTNYDLPEYKNAAISLGATHFLDKAHDYPRLPRLLEELREIRGRPH